MDLKKPHIKIKTKDGRYFCYDQSSKTLYKTDVGYSTFTKVCECEATAINENLN